MWFDGTMVARNKNTQVMSVWDAISNRRAVRGYSVEPVKEKTVQFLIEQSTLAPSAVNAQPWAFVVIQKPDTLKKISDRAKEAMRIDPRWKNARGHGALHLADENFDVFYGASTLILICAKTESPWAVGDCCLAAQNLMLSACGLGLGTCPIGLALETFNTDSVRREVGIPNDFTPVLPIIVGFPSGVTPKTERDPPKILNWIRNL
jgi:nitroreductase